jgi:hypothetical protein
VPTYQTPLGQQVRIPARRRIEELNLSLVGNESPETLAALGLTLVPDTPALTAEEQAAADRANKTTQAAEIAATHPDVPGKVAEVLALVGYAITTLGVALPADRLPTFAEIGQALLNAGTDEAYRLYTQGRLNWDIILGACGSNYDLAYDLAPYLAALAATPPE